MPWAALRPCPGRGGRCPNRIARQERKCPECSRRTEESRGSAAERGYDWRWAQYALRFRERHPRCGDTEPGAYPSNASRCRREGRVTGVIGKGKGVVHHIRGHQGPEDPEFWNPLNHESLCPACHNAVTNEGDFGR